MKITVQPFRDEALQVGYLALTERLPPDISFDVFCERMKDWDVSAFHDGSRAVGMLMTRGPELHVAVIPEVRGRWLSRRLINEVFAPIIGKHGRAVTSVASDNARGLEFVRRIRAGFADLTFDPVTAIAGVGVITGLIGADAAGDAADAQVAASDRAGQTQLQMFNTINRQQTPWRQAGENALNSLSRGLGLGSGTSAAVGNGPLTADQVQQIYQRYMGRPVLADEMASVLATNKTAYDLERGVSASPEHQFHVTQQRNVGAIERPLFSDGSQPATASQGGVTDGQFTHQFNAADLKTELAPNYQFMLDQGLGATKNAANLQTGLLSGNTLKGINDYTQNYASNAYQQAFQNYTANQSNIFNRLATIAGLGQTANQTSATAGTAAGQGIAGAQMAGGQAAASGIVGGANALAGGLQNAASWYALPQIMNQGGVAGQGG